MPSSSDSTTGTNSADDAAAALCLMANLEPQLSSDLHSQQLPSPMSSQTSPLESFLSQQQLPLPHSDPPNFVSRVSNIPVVTSAVNTISNFYESSKASSSILKYGAETVESSVRKIYRPLQPIVTPQLSQIDSFGCKQLDKIQEQFPIVMDPPDQLYQKGTKYLQGIAENAMDRIFNSGQNKEPAMNRIPSQLENGSASSVFETTSHGKRQTDTNMNSLRKRPSPSHSLDSNEGRVDKEYTMLSASESEEEVASHASSVDSAMKLSKRSKSRRNHSKGTQSAPYSPSSSSMSSPSPSSSTFNASNNVMRMEQSGWRSNLQGLYGKSFDSLNSIRDTVNLMQTVEVHIERQTSHLTESLHQVQLYILSKSTAISEEFVQQRDQWLVNISSTTIGIRREIVNGLRQVVNAISKSAVFMPNYAQAKIKDFILSLPQRWASLANSALTQLNGQDETRFLQEGHQMLTLANETRQMLRSVMAIFLQYIDRVTIFLQSLPFSTPPPQALPAPEAVVNNDGSSSVRTTSDYPMDLVNSSSSSSSSSLSSSSPSSSPSSPNHHHHHHHDDAEAIAASAHGNSTPFSIATLLSQEAMANGTNGPLDPNSSLLIDQNTSHASSKDVMQVDG